MHPSLKIVPTALAVALSFAAQSAQAQTDSTQGNTAIVTTNNAFQPAPPSATTLVAPAPQSLESLLAPIALYPDALIALILPASTHSSDVVLAARYIDAKGDPDAVGSQSWDDSVKALVHYPAVLTWMDDNLSWTQALGDAFAAQPADVMNAVQRLRTQARAAGTLVDTPQQRVVADGTNWLIVPAQPDVIYVPVYDPDTIYLSNTLWIHRPFITFSYGYPRSSWLIYDCNWQRHNVWAVSRPPGRYQPQWNRPINPTPHRPRSPNQPGLPNGFQPRAWNAPRPPGTVPARPNPRPSSRLIPPGTPNPNAGQQPARLQPTTPFRPIQPQTSAPTVITPPIPRNRPNPNQPNTSGFQPRTAPGFTPVAPSVNRSAPSATRPAPAVRPAPSANVAPPGDGGGNGGGRPDGSRRDQRDH